VIRFRHRDIDADAARDAAPAEAEGVEEHRSPGLQAALAGHAARVGCRVLVTQLQRATRPGSVLFLLIHEAADMPAAAPVFEIRDDDRIAYRASGSDSTPTPKIPPAEVARRLPCFRVDASFILRHGIREYVAVRVRCDEDHIS
jgi:hypothetical protein